MPSDNLSRKMNIFSALTESELNDLLAVGEKHMYDAGESIVLEGDTNRSLGFILSGSCQVIRKLKDGKRFIVARLKKGESFGELALLLDIPRSATIEARNRSEILWVTYEKYHQYTRDHPALNQFLLLITARRLHNTTKHLTRFALFDVATRLLYRLIELAEAEPTRASMRRCKLPTQLELAEMIGSSREVVNRALNLLESAGEIIREDGILYIDVGQSKIEP